MLYLSMLHINPTSESVFVIEQCLTAFIFKQKTHTAYNSYLATKTSSFQQFYHFDGESQLVKREFIINQMQSKYFVRSIFTYFLQSSFFIIIFLSAHWRFKLISLILLDVKSLITLFVHIKFMNYVELRCRHKERKNSAIISLCFKIKTFPK